jgi:hypothetical protein
LKEWANNANPNFIHHFAAPFVEPNLWATERLDFYPAKTSLRQFKISEAMRQEMHCHSPK